MTQTLVDFNDFSPNIRHLLFSSSKLRIPPRRCAGIRSNSKFQAHNSRNSASNIAAPLIFSPSNSFIKHCLKLRQSSSYRHFHASVVVVGLTPIREISRFQESQREGTSILDCLLLLDGADVPEGLHVPFTRIVRVSSVVMKKLSGLQSIDSTEAVALMRIPRSFCNLDSSDGIANCESWFPSRHRILALDGIQDPGNLGTLLRSAMAFNWANFNVHRDYSMRLFQSRAKAFVSGLLHGPQEDGVFLLPGCCDPFNDKALRAARGASFQLPIVSGKWAHLQSLTQQFQMTMMAGHPIHGEERRDSLFLSRELADVLAGQPLCLVLGSEGHGLSEESKMTCKLASIPMAGKFESLNVSIAGGIFLFMLQHERQIVT